MISAEVKIHNDFTGSKNAYFINKFKCVTNHHLNFPGFRFFLNFTCI